MLISFKVNGFELRGKLLLRYSVENSKLIELCYSADELKQKPPSL
jgi:hypothetical protein